MYTHTQSTDKMYIHVRIQEGGRVTRSKYKTSHAATCVVIVKFIYRLMYGRMYSVSSQRTRIDEVRVTGMARRPLPPPACEYFRETSNM